MSSLSIYKPGQGYWTRVCSAVGAGTMVLAGVAWFYHQFPVLGESQTREAPRTVLIAALEKSTNQSMGEIATIEVNNGNVVIEDSLKKVHTVAVSQFNQTFDTVAIATPDVKTKPDPADLVRVQPSGENGKNLAVTYETMAFRNSLYLKTAICGVIIAAFAIVLYSLLNRPRIVEFMIATESEMRKVNWPTRRETIGTTWIVICGTAMMAFLLFSIDVLFAKFFQLIGVLVVTKT